MAYIIIIIRYISLVIPKVFGRLSFQFSAASDWNELQKSLKLESFIYFTNYTTSAI
jgi:hypothetical protein